mgnify:CR=1 FL=1
MPVLLTIRDVAIIVVAAMSVVAGVLLIVLILELRGLSRLLRQEGKPIFDSARETMGTVQGTAGFISDNFVAPFIRLASFSTGVQAALRFLTRRAWRRRRGK